MKQISNVRKEQSTFVTISWFLFEILFFVLVITAVSVAFLAILQLCKMLTVAINLKSPITWYLLGVPSFSVQ